jgi:hypothetical protein
VHGSEALKIYGLGKAQFCDGSFDVSQQMGSPHRESVLPVRVCETYRHGSGARVELKRLSLLTKGSVRHFQQIRMQAKTRNASWMSARFS